MVGLLIFLSLEVNGGWKQFPVLIFQDLEFDGSL